MKLYKKIVILLAVVTALGVGAFSAYANLINPNLLNNVASPKVKPATITEEANQQEPAKITTMAETKSASSNEITVTTNNADKKVNFEINIPEESGKEVSVICMTPRYTKSTIEDWSQEQGKVCHLEQILLDAQGKGSGQIALETIISGDYKLSIGTQAKSYLKTFSLSAIKNGWVSGVYYKNDVVQKNKWVGSKYYTDKNGKKTANKVLTIKKKRYAFNKSGVRQTGTKWVTIKKTKYYVKKGLVKPNVWVGKYRTNNKGARIKNAIVKVKKKLYVIKNSKRQTGNKVITFKKSKYYVNKKGIVTTKKTISYKGKKYKANAKGALKLVK